MKNYSYPYTVYIVDSYLWVSGPCSLFVIVSVPDKGSRRGGYSYYSVQGYVSNQWDYKIVKSVQTRKEARVILAALRTI